MIKPNSKWSSTDMQVFHVKDIEYRKDGVWVIYSKHAEDREYECLVDAFMTRFTENIN